MLNALASTRQGSKPATPSIHRLGPGLPGYLIPFAPLAFAPQRQCRPSNPPSPPVFFPISTHFTATLGIPIASSALEPGSFVSRSGVEPRAFTPDLHGPPTRPLRPVIPNNACPLRITAAAGTELAGASSLGTVKLRRIRSKHFVPSNRSLQSEDLHPPRGVASSGLRPLRTIPHCCLP